MRKVHIFLANTIFLLHLLLGIFFFVGWLFPQIKIFYLMVLVIWISTWIFLGYCPPSKLEFHLRNKHDNTIDPNSEIIKYYLKKFFKIEVSPRLVYNGGLVAFIILAILTFVVR